MGERGNKESWGEERKKMSKKIIVRVGATWIKGQEKLSHGRCTKGV